jgi:hypothetical protein
MNSSQDKLARVRHPVRASGTLAILALFLTIGIFMAFAFELAGGTADPVILAVTGGATIVSFFFWVRENRIAQLAANAPRAPRHEIKASWLIPLQAGLVMAYVAALLAAIHYVPELSGFPKGLLQSLPIGLVAGWVVVWIYIVVESDEMIRSLMITATAIAAGAVVGAATVWGLIALHTPVGDLPLIFLFPAFAMIYGFAAAYLTRRYT